MTDYLLFGLFAATLFGIAVAHKHALRIALAGLACVLLTRIVLTDFHVFTHLGHEGKTLLNLGGLLLGFSVLANYFERSHLPDKLVEVLPAGRGGAFALLVLVALMSAVLDNIAAALIGGAAAITLFQRRVHIGYLAAIVAASNAGGAGSVIGDTTTTMMWIAGVSWVHLLEAYTAAGTAVLFFGWVASRQQNALQPLVRGGGTTKPLDLASVGIVLLILAGAILTNVFLEMPAVGVWAAILVGGLVRRPDWKVMPAATVGACFLLSLVLSASMMPVESLPPASPWTSLGLGGISACFDNIPLTALAIRQGGYDWAFLAYCVGFGGSMLWFGSSAGVAISGLFPEARSVKNWVRDGWHVAVGYVLGFIAMYAIAGWHPQHLELGHPHPGNGAPPAQSQPLR